MTSETRGREEARKAGREWRKRVPRLTLAASGMAVDRDPVQILIDQGAGRVPELLPLRYARMLVSPFTFYRGAAAVMASDLAQTPNTGMRVQLAGDAHLVNFGAYASPDRDLVFDVNDFDETLPGPFEWDLKRLVASFAVSCRERGMSRAVRREVLVAATESYRRALQEFAEQTRLEVWYARLDVSAIPEEFAPGASRAQRRTFEKLMTKARTKTSARALDQMTSKASGHLELISSPPLLVPAAELLGPGDVEKFETIARQVFLGYRRSLPPDRRLLFADYELVGLARKVVGVGSVGTRCWVALFTANGDDDDALVLQLKQADASVLEPHAGRSRVRNHGQRVVEGQRLMQASSDIFLGWTRGVDLENVEHDFYVRQLWDWKGSADLENMQLAGFLVYAHVCGWTLARAHARSGDRFMLAGYLGTSSTLAEALADYAESYADMTEADHEALVHAAEQGRIEVADAQA